MASQADLYARAVQYLQAQNPLLQPARGGTLWQLLTAVTQGAADTQAKVDAGALQAQIGTASGDGLTAQAADRAVYRKPAAAATAPGVFTRVPADPNNALTIPANTPVGTAPQPGSAPIAFFSLAAATILAGQTASNTVTVQAMVGGAAGNVGIGQISQVTQGPAGVAFANSAAATGGADTESDASLRNRVYLSVAPANSPQEVAAAALAVPGIFAAVVVDAQDGAGNYTVYASDVNGALSGALSGAVTTAIAAVDGIGLTRHVSAVTVLSQAVAANIVVDGNYTYAAVAAAVQAAITTYIASLQPGAVLHPSDLTRAVFGALPGYTPVAGLVAFYPTTPAAAVVPANAYTLIRLSGTPTIIQVAN